MLDKSGGYRLEDRGEVDDDDDDGDDDHDYDEQDDMMNILIMIIIQVSVKGKGAMITFWLVGEEPALRAARFTS